MKSLKDRVKELGNSLPLMEDREKGVLDNIMNQPLTITNFGFLKDEKNEEYVVFITKEDELNFYFGGSVLTQDLKALSEDGYADAIIKDGLPIQLEKRKSKTGNIYTAVKYL